MTAAGPARKRLHLAALPHPGPRADGPAFPPAASYESYASYERLARTAERGLFDFLLLAGGPFPGEPEGRVPDADPVGPEPVTALSALAAVTDRLGLAAMVDASCNEPYELARRLATLDHLSGGRAAWHPVTSADATTGGNLRRGGGPDRAERYPRIAEFTAAAGRLWDSWTPRGEAGPVAYRGRHFDIAGEFTVPRPPQGHPVLIQTGDSDEGREFAAATADVVCCGRNVVGRPPAGPGARLGPFEAARAFYADVKRRLRRYGRAPDDLKVMPAVGVVLGDTAAEARDRAAELIGPPVPPPTDPDAWTDPDGWTDSDTWTDPDARSADDPRSADDAWSADDALTAVDGRAATRARTVIEAARRPCFVGPPEAVAAELDAFVRRDAADGFVLVPHVVPGALEEFVDRVVPLLQERGAFRTEYRGTTLRSHLGLGAPARKD
ncbi:NtaA/DmoA family FMN-dependent monooxygenase [Streptomyces sp. NPDC001508]|uniref:NtaA/DmoA family FMN-dependent monooxygenase n=1 Tax=Streptomyces sp. NPDC001508 TaxID=3154656 RepID=UPI0033205509